MTDVLIRHDVIGQLVKSVGSDVDLAAAARVSTLGDESLETLAQDPTQLRGLLRFLMKNRHGTPFEHASLTFFVQAPIFVFREFHRHRIGWSYNEESGRYKQLAAEFYAPAPERPLVQVGKAGAYEFVPGSDAQWRRVQNSIRRTAEVAYGEYESMLEQGIAREVARAVLPVNTYTSMYATCNPRSLMAFLSLRTKAEGSLFPSYPQREIEMVAEQLEESFASLFPVTYDAFCEFGRVAP